MKIEKNNQIEQHPFVAEQPNTIMLDGVEIPSWYFVWLHFREVNEKIERLTTGSIVKSIAIIILALWQLWK